MKSFIVSLIIIFSFQLSAQEKLYHPEADAKKDIENAVILAQKENKNVILQIGGNWCSWCILFDKFIKEDQEIKSFVSENYIYYHLNYSKENKNQDILDTLGNPEKNGFPVLVVLDSSGKLLSTQETGSLEEGKGYNQEKVMNFFKNNIPESIQ